MIKDNKWTHFKIHFLSSLAGFPAYFLAHPWFALRLIAIRMRYYFTEKLRGATLTPDQFLIESPEDVYYYWGFFIEREMLDREWVSALKAAADPVVIDVGANAGLFAHRIWTLNPRTKLIVFEPLPKMAKKIARWGETTGARLTLHSKAVSDRVGTSSYYALSENDVTASLKSEGAHRLKFEVPVVTLDSVVSEMEILMIKIDVEGVECEVLAGARQTLQRARFLTVEAHTPEALARIKAQLTPEWRCRQTGMSDYLFMRSSN